MSIVRVLIKKITRARLKKYGHEHGKKGDTYDILLNNLLDKAEGKNK